MYSSEALKSEIFPPEGLNEDELQEWYGEHLDPDAMGFDGHEGTLEEGVIDASN